MDEVEFLVEVRPLCVLSGSESWFKNDQTSGTKLSCALIVDISLPRLPKRVARVTTTTQSRTL